MTVKIPFLSLSGLIEITRSPALAFYWKLSILMDYIGRKINKIKKFGTYLNIRTDFQGISIDIFLPL